VHAWQALRSDDDQRHYRDDDQFRKIDLKHESSQPEKNERVSPARLPKPTTDRLILWIFLDLAFDGMAKMLFGLGGLVGRGFAHAFLESLDALPISLPTLPSFLVPNTAPQSPARSTSAKCSSFHDFLLQSSHHRADRLRAAEDMKMQMIHLLSTHPAGVGDKAKAVVQSFAAGQLAGFDEHLAKQRLVARTGVVERAMWVFGMIMKCTGRFGSMS